MRKPIVVSQVVPKLQNFTIESITKYLKKNEKTLLDKIFMFPSFGQGFKVFMRRRPQDYYIVDNVEVKNHRHGKIFGVFYPNGVMGDKITKIRRTLQDGRWGFEYPEGKCYTENGIEYDIKKIEQLRSEKNALMTQRNKEIGFVPKIIQDRLDAKKAKLEAAAKKKK